MSSHVALSSGNKIAREGEKVTLWKDSVKKELVSFHSLCFNDLDLNSHYVLLFMDFYLNLSKADAEHCRLQVKRMQNNLNIADSLNVPMHSIPFYI